jgi:hypothetical protein
MDNLGGGGGGGGDDGAPFSSSSAFPARLTRFSFSSQTAESWTRLVVDCTIPTLQLVTIPLPVEIERKLEKVSLFGDSATLLFPSRVHRRQLSRLPPAFQSVQGMDTASPIGLAGLPFLDITSSPSLNLPSAPPSLDPDSPWDGTVHFSPTKRSKGKRRADKQREPAPLEAKDHNKDEGNLVDVESSDSGFSGACEPSQYCTR